MNDKKEKGIVDQMRQDRKILPIAVGCGILAVVLTYFYLKSKEEPYGPPSPVIVAAIEIEQGATFSMENVEVKEVPQMHVAPGSITPEYLSSILDMPAVVPILPGQPILWSHVQTERSTTSLSEALIKEYNERAVTIAVDEISGVAGHIQPNDRVDVIGTFEIPSTKPEQLPVIKTKTILQCVTVLAVGAATATTTQVPQFGMSNLPTSVTLKVKPEEAELLAFAEGSGKLRLMLRHMDDLEVDEEIPVIDFNNLFEIEKKQTQARRDYIRVIYGREQR